MRPSAPSTVVSVLAVLALSLAGCGDPEQVIETDGVASSDAAASADGVDGADPGAKSAGDEGSTDAPGTDEGPPIPVGDARWARPLGAVAVRMCVDDSANETYEDGQILWTGSWSWSQDTNLIDFSTSWLPEEGPYPPLYDDGPYTAGGHESADAVAGDSVFCAEIWVMPDAADDLLFEYGALDELRNWIWVGPNGTFTVPAAATEDQDVPGMEIPAFGTFDMKITVDLAGLHEEHATVAGDTHDVFVKGTMSSWFPAQLLDDGELGDGAAGDGVYTYIQSAYLGDHSGLLAEGQEAQFVFVFARSGLTPDLGVEYKVGGDAVPDGVRAFSDHPAGDGATWVEEAVIQAPDSRGKAMNTAIVVGGGEGTTTPCDDAPNPCEAGSSCVDGECVPDSTSTCPDPADLTSSGVDAARLVAPHEVDAFTGAELPELSATVLASGITDGVGRASAVEAQFGLALAGSDWCADAAWSWATATWLRDESDGSEAFGVVRVAPAAAGAYVFAFRFRVSEGPWVWSGRDGSTNGTDPSALGALAVSDPPTDPSVESIEPSVGSVLGGTSVHVRGAALDPASIEVLFDGVAGRLQAGVSTAFDVVVLAPAHAEGDVAITVKQGGADVSVPSGAFRYVRWATPTADGVVQVGGGADWDDALLVTTNTVASAWTDANRLEALYAAFDATYLYIGIRGTAGDDNAIVALVDLDAGAGTGLTSSEAFSDDGGEDLDDAISSMFTSLPSGFGAEVAFGTVSMASRALGTDLSTSSHAGWRRLTEPDSSSEVPWIDGEVLTHRDEAGVEARIELANIFPAGVPEGGASIDVVVRLGNGAGDVLSNQGLPPVEEAGDPAAVVAAARFELVSVP